MSAMSAQRSSSGSVIGSGEEWGLRHQNLFLQSHLGPAHRFAKGDLGLPGAPVRKNSGAGLGLLAVDEQRACAILDGCARR